MLHCASGDLKGVAGRSHVFKIHLLHSSNENSGIFPCIKILLENSGNTL